MKNSKLPSNKTCSLSDMSQKGHLVMVQLIRRIVTAKQTVASKVNTAQAELKDTRLVTALNDPLF
jgi:hypothetical protein